ncbi:hypothetical protein AMATHDRAFT_68521 [Amanita thiersii Skay4041]|uniref:G-patch domain-containing protein n=1 Tax=Amanita thiersii Skay4041 TaxID=703135 RepID=A0A2A9NH03_9AGAR|nr:hypothetical protein AMATHDRAFT_68521 [Amanita thiersii Skay4041]
MAYNREWDRGKESWGEPAAWGATDTRTNVRSREDDYYGEGKRRRFNNGGFNHDIFHQYDDAVYENTPQIRQSDHQEHPHDTRPRGSGAGSGFKKRLTPSEPSPHVIFLGLDPDFTEADLQTYLTSHGCSIETVTIIRERSTGTSKGFGFAQFTSTEHARSFVDPLFPFIQVPPPASHGATATSAFYKSVESGLSHNGRRVKIDYSQSATPHDRSRSSKGNMNDGTRDIGNTQSPLLLFRGLDPLSGPQAIYQAMLYSSGPGRQGPKGMRRIILIKDKTTMASYGFAFVEFVDVQSASAVLAATMSPQLHPNGFRISDKPVATSFAHPYSFQPVTDFIQRDEACLKSTSSSGGVEGLWVRYWDENSTCAVLEFKVEEPSEAAPIQKAKREKKKPKVDQDTHAPQQAITPSALPVSDKPVTLSFNKGITKVTTVHRQLAPGISMDDDSTLPEAADDDGDTNIASSAKKIAPLSSNKKTVDNIQKWNHMQEELAKDSEFPLARHANAITPSHKEKTGSPVPESECDFADVNALMCLLCARQFKSLEQLTRHNIESELHKKNLKDNNLREVARQKLTVRKATAGHQQQPKYRDRASERRILFNQPETPMPDEHGRPINKKRYSEGPLPPPSPPVPPVNLGQDENNVGNKMLKLMGWKEGQGLGTEGDGRLEPIQTAIYAQGVGLGAGKGKDIGRYTEGYSGYVHMAQDAARERYENQDHS